MLIWSPFSLILNTGTTDLPLEPNDKESFSLNTSRQNGPQNVFPQPKLPSTKFTYKCSAPQSRVFTYGLKAGNFTHQGEVNNMTECIQHCAQQLNCSAAFMVRRFCFSVKCYSQRSCDTSLAVHSGYNPQLSFITHLPQATTKSHKGKFIRGENRPQKRRCTHTCEREGSIFSSLLQIIVKSCYEYCKSRKLAWNQLSYTVLLYVLICSVWWSHNLHLMVMLVHNGVSSDVKTNKASRMSGFKSFEIANNI